MIQLNMPLREILNLPLTLRLNIFKESMRKEYTNPGKLLIALLFFPLLVLASFEKNGIHRILPEDLVYVGAFRLPDDETGSYAKSWNYGGHSMTYYPYGDLNGPDDGYPGSIFAAGHAWEHQVSEIDIPVPIMSEIKNLNDLNSAKTLQSFQDLMDVSDLEIPRTGLAYLPSQGSQTTPKLYFCWGYHMQDGPPDLTHGWCELDLSTPQIQGGWYLAGLPPHIQNMSTNDYMSEIPSEWADTHTPGMRLATGRFRDGGWSGQGPALFAIGPWNQGNPPLSGAAIQNVPLILYSSTYSYDSENHTMNNHHHSDEWSGTAWITAGDKSAVIFVGTKGFGDCWYGNPEGPCLECENRGWWSDEFRGQFLFYDTSELAEVAAGIRQPWEPQPYATMDIDRYLFNITSNQQKHHVNACRFDRISGVLYVFEYLADGDKPLIHVWKVISDSDSPPKRNKKGGVRR